MEEPKLEPAAAKTLKSRWHPRNRKDLRAGIVRTAPTAVVGEGKVAGVDEVGAQMYMRSEVCSKQAVAAGEPVQGYSTARESAFAAGLDSRGSCSTCCPPAS